MINIKNIDTLYQKSSEELDDIINDISLDSEKYDKEYQKLSYSNRRLRQKYTSLRMIYENVNPKKLNKEEIDALITILDNELKMKYIIYEKMFILGNKEAFYYFKRMGIIKEENEK